MQTAGPLHIRIREHRDAVLVQPNGVLDARSYPHLRDCLIKCATQVPSAVIVDVDELAVTSAYAMSVFSTVWMQVNEWPGVPLLLLATEPTRRAQLASSPVSRFVPVHGDLQAAMRAVGRPPARHWDRLTLPATAASSAVARCFVRRTCRRWGVGAAEEDAAAIATELVENVIQHTASTAELRLELRNGMLSIAVSDNDRRPAAGDAARGGRPRQAERRSCDRVEARADVGLHTDRRRQDRLGGPLGQLSAGQVARPDGAAARIRSIMAVVEWSET